MIVDGYRSPILWGSYQLPPSINQNTYHPVVGRNGSIRIRKDEIAVQYVLDLQSHLDYPDERYDLWRDETGLQIVRDWAVTLRRKQHLKATAKPAYYLHCLYCFADDKRDIDGGHKCFQDALCSWIGLNDNRIWQVSLFKCINAAFPHVEFTFGPLRTLYESGDLVAEVRESLKEKEAFYAEEPIAS